MVSKYSTAVSEYGYLTKKVTSRYSLPYLLQRVHVKGVSVHRLLFPGRFITFADPVFFKSFVEKSKQRDTEYAGGCYQ